MLPDLPPAPQQRGVLHSEDKEGKLMAFISNKERNFEKYLKNHFGIVLPKGLQLFYAQGVRIGNDELMKSVIHGELGYAACDSGFNPTNAMAQNFGHLATKNVYEVDEPNAQGFAVGG